MKVFSGDCLWNRNSGVSITTSTHSHYSTTTTHFKFIQNTFYIYTSCPSSSVQPCAPSPPPCSLLPASWWWWWEGNTGIASHKILFFQKKNCVKVTLFARLLSVCTFPGKQLFMHSFIHTHITSATRACILGISVASQPSNQVSFFIIIIPITTSYHMIKLYTFTHSISSRALDLSLHHQGCWVGTCATPVAVVVVWIYLLK